MALIEGSAARILAGQANRNAGFHNAREGQRLGHAVVDFALPCPHFGALLEQFFYFGMDMETLGIGGKPMG